MDYAAAFQRNLPVDRVRQTLIIPGRFLVPEQTRLIARICHAEPTWLDWALNWLGLQGGVDSLLAH